MNIKVWFDAKNRISSEDAFDQTINCLGVLTNITRKENYFIIQLEGEERDAIEVLRLIWELSFLYEGFFYPPKEYLVDGEKREIENLYFLSYYKTGKMWIDSSVFLTTTNGAYSEERIFAYKTLRNTGRESEKLYKELINSFFYLHSEAYDGINVNHRLSLLLNTCDGIGINFEGKINNVEANISNTIKNNLDVKLIKYGSALLGISKNKMMNALKAERDEIDHYVYKKGSLSNRLVCRTDIQAKYVNWYFVYILDLAIRISLLKQLDIECVDERKIYALNEINDWIILSCDIKERCRNPKNILKQKLLEKGKNSN